MKSRIRNIIGYLIGITAFLFVIPSIMYLISVRFVSPVNSNIAIKILSVFFAMIGVIFMLWSNIYMYKVGRGCPTDGFNISIGERTKKLMTDGPYKYSRNPMLFGTFMFYIAVALFLKSYSALLFPLLFILYMTWHVKKYEESRLYNEYGESYLKYKKSVSMIFPFFIKNNN